MYAVLMIDLQNSRGYPLAQRQEIQQRVMNILDALNPAFARSVIRRVEFSGGDEVQGLFQSPESAYLFYRLFAMASGVGVRAGIGCGSWDVQIERAGSAAQDGTAYHRARAAIQAARGEKDAVILFRSETAMDPMVNTLIGAAAGAMKKMSQSQRDVMLLTELFSPLLVRSEYEPDALMPLFSTLNCRIQIPETLKSQIVPVVLSRQESAFFTTGGRCRGVPGKIAACLHITRQSVEKSQKAADVYGERNLSMAALACMSQWREG